MSEDIYLSALQKAQAALVQAVNDRDELNLKIVRLQQLVKVLTGATENEAPGSNETIENLSARIGFTEAVLTILRNSRDELTARNIRDRMVELGYELGKYANPLGFIHSVLGRLEAQGKIRQTAPGTYAFRDAFYEALLAVKCATTQNTSPVPSGSSEPDAGSHARAANRTLLDAYSTKSGVLPGGDPPPLSGEALAEVLRVWGLASSNAYDKHSTIPPPPKISDVEKGTKK
ncbi:MAG TPA: hypothetical protein VK805_17825 [Candidatus Baltobacteraceae bacterium]|jgi:hypothetical protein|nr:hypothetical protein [Candidatus Baltobacteraceae bacterium]